MTDLIPKLKDAADDAERRAFNAGWHARVSGSGSMEGGQESAFGFYLRGGTFGDDDDGETEPRAPAILRLIERVERLSAALSWIEPPFVDENTPVAELRKRVALAVADARQTLESQP